MNVPATAAVAALAAGAAFVASASEARETNFSCTNPASGARWQIRIDFARQTVDAAPARIGENDISWHDERAGAGYTLDRKSGELTVVVASSTGGYFLHDRCKPKGPR